MNEWLGWINVPYPTDVWIVKMKGYEKRECIDTRNILVSTFDSWVLFSKAMMDSMYTSSSPSIGEEE